MNFQRREALATLRYAIDARKGLTLLIGEAGTGKSTLLRELERELGANVTCVSIADPRTTLADLLRSLLNRLRIERLPADDPTLIQQGLAVLRSHAETGRLVAVILDEAHHMDDRQLELIVQKLTSPGSEKSHTSLVQLILAGRPELKERLFQPPLRSLGSMIAIECKLVALTAKEVGDYIAHRLQLANREPELFDNDAVQQVTSYSDGKIGTVNTICDRVLEMADGSPRKLVDARLIDAAAKDLSLWKPRWVRKEESPKPEADFTIPREGDKLASSNFRFGGEDTSETVGQTFVHLSGSKDPISWFRPRDRGGKSGTRTVFIVAAILALPGMWLYSDEFKKSLRESSVVIGDLIDEYVQPPSPSETARVAERAEPKRPDAVQPISPPEPPPASIVEESEPTAAPPNKVEENQVPIAPPAAAKPVKPERRKPNPPIAAAKQIPPEPPTRSQDDLARQISKAIENRAIDGVSVTIKNNIVYLDGRVATERQRRAAENAARDIGDVAGLRNRIAVE